MDIVDFVLNNIAIFFYLAIIILIYLNRKKFEIHAKIIALYKTNMGLDFMKKIAKKHKELIKIIGYSGIGIGFIGMFVMAFTFIKNPFDVISGAPPGVVPVVPGIDVPGSPIFIPLFSGWIALFLVILVHEFSHGIVATAHNVKVKSSGFLFLGPIMGAFVEPDEKKLKKKNDVVKYSIFSAGPFSNVILALLSLTIIALVLNPAFIRIAEPAGFTIGEVVEGGPAENSGLESGMVITMVNSNQAQNYNTLMTEINRTDPGESIYLATNKRIFEIETSNHPENNEKAYLGISDIKNYYQLVESFTFLEIFHPILIIQEAVKFCTLIFILSLGIGIVNLLPLGPIDGGRMLHTSLISIMGKKKGQHYWQKVSLFFAVLLFFNIALSFVSIIF